MPRHEIEMQPVTKPKSCDFEGVIGFGQNPKGFTAETANGTAKAGNRPGWNRSYEFTKSEVPATGAWSNANRSGE
jgi:hypothetical protein